MSSSSVADRVFDLLAPLADEHAFELVACEIAGTKGSPVIRVYLDRDGGVDLDAIAQANAWISDALDAEPPSSGSWVLEVSSPGIERPLRRLEDFAKYAGERATVSTVRPIDGRRRFTGGIVGVEDDEVVLDCDGTRCSIPHAEIAKANLKPDITFGED